MPTSTTSFYFKVSNLDKSFTIDTQQNIKKHIGEVLYLESPPDDSVNLFYVGSKELNALENIFIADRSTNLYENSKSNETEYLGVYRSSVGLKNDNFIVTQEFIEADSGYIPMYYKHSLPTTINPDSVKIFDKDFNEQFLFKIVLIEDRDEDTGIPTGDYLSYDIFNSYLSYFDFDTAEYEAYFIQYTYLDGGVTKSVTKLLDNELAYKQATWDDYWSETFYLKPWKRVYNINENLLLQLPTNTQFALRYLETKRLSVKYPSSVSNSEPWFLRISNSSFRTAYGSFNYKYSVAEFSNQAFNPIEPYKRAINIKAYKVTDRLLSLPAEDIQEGSSFANLTILFEKNGNIEHALTSDTSLNGTAYTNIKGQRSINSITGAYVNWDSDSFLSYDKLSGMVYVNVDIDDSYDIIASFSYKEDFYTLTSLNLNPIFNPIASETIHVVYIVPEASHNGNIGTQNASIMWLQVSKTGLILDTNQDGSGNNENIKQSAVLSSTDGYGIDGVIDLHYGWKANTITTSSFNFGYTVILNVQSTANFPNYGWLRAKDHSGDYRYFRYVAKSSTSFTLDVGADYIPSNGSPGIPSGGTVELVNFIDERTTQTTRSSSSELSSFGETTGLPSVFSRYFILAETSLNQPHGIHDLAIIDVRQNGGGIKSDLYEEAKLKNPEVQWFSDFNDFSGQVTPGNAVLVVKLPISILDSFSLDELRRIVNDRSPAGVYPVIKFYGYKPRIISVESISAGIEITWEKEGEEFTYDIWYSEGEDGPWIKANNTLVVDDSVASENTYTITGLVASSIYSVKITMRDRYYMWWYGYSDYDSIEGGLGLEEDTPVAPFGNWKSFYFEIV